MKPSLKTVVPFYWKNPRWIFRFLLEWIKYTPHFFAECPVARWWDYFDSSWRVCHGLTQYAFMSKDMNGWDKHCLISEIDNHLAASGKEDVG